MKAKKGRAEKVEPPAFLTNKTANAIFDFLSGGASDHMESALHILQDEGFNSYIYTVIGQAHREIAGEFGLGGYGPVRGSATGMRLGHNAAKAGTQITKHAAEQMVERGITQKMVETGISKGTKYFDPKNGHSIMSLKTVLLQGRIC